MKKKNYFGIAFVIYFIVSIAFMVYFSRLENGTPYLMMDFGQLFLVGGIIYLFSKSHDLGQKLIGLFCTILGLGTILISYMYAKTNIINDENIGIIVAIAVISLVDIYSIGHVIISFIRERRALNFNDVEAELIERNVVMSGHDINQSEWHSDQTYELKFKYQYNGKEYNYQPTGDYLEVGTKVVLKVNPNNPSEAIWEELNSANKKSGIIFLILAIIMTIGIVISMLIN